MEINLKLVRQEIKAGREIVIGSSNGAIECQVHGSENGLKRVQAVKGCLTADCLKATVNKSQSACYYHYVPVILNNVSDKIPLPPKILLHIPFS